MLCIDFLSGCFRIAFVILGCVLHAIVGVVPAFFFVTRLLLFVVCCLICFCSFDCFVCIDCCFPPDCVFLFVCLRVCMCLLFVCLCCVLVAYMYIVVFVCGSLFVGVLF